MVFGDILPPFSLLESITFAATPLGVGARGGLGTRQGQTMMTNIWFAMRPIALPPVRQTRLGGFPTFDPIAELPVAMSAFGTKRTSQPDMSAGQPGAWRRWQGRPVK